MLTVLIVFLFSTLPVMAQAGTGSVSASVYTQQQFLMYGTTSSGDWNIYSDLFETDDDVLSCIDDNILYLYDSNHVFKDLTIDWMDSSIGLWSSDEDWSGTVGSTTDTADGGNYYALANASTPTESSATGDGFTWSSLGKKNPSNGGYSFSVTATSAESSENADTDAETRCWTLEDDLIDVSVSSDSWIYVNVAVTFAGVNETKDTKCTPYFLFSDGVNQVGMGLIFDASETDDTAWTDGSTTQVTGSVNAEEDFVYLAQDVATASTVENWVGVYNIEDVLQNSADYSTFSPATFVEYGVVMSSAYSGESVTIEFNQVTVVNNLKDFSLWETTDSDDTSADRLNNFPNSTTRDISEWDEYELENGLVFALDHTELPINCLTFSKYMSVFSYDESEFTASTSTSVTREDIFDTLPPTDERLTSPTTIYANLSGYSDTDYTISQIWIASEAVFNDKGRLNSGYAIYDTNSAPTISELSDIESNLDDLSGNLRLSHSDLNTAANYVQLVIQYEKPASESVNTGTYTTTTAAGGITTGSTDFGFEAIVVVVIILAAVTGLYLYKRK